MTKLRNPNRKSGFTLIEILVVIGIIAVLAAIVVIAINPAKQFAQARNAQRTANINAILNAVGQRMADNKGVFEGKFTIDTVDYYCPKLVDGAINTTSEPAFTTPVPTSGNLGCLSPTYISSLPTDPVWISGADTLYDLTLSSAGRVKICAPESLNEKSLPAAPEICVER